MNLEIRNPKSEIRNSALTPSELAALLGPPGAELIEPPSAEIVNSATCWTSFAETFAKQLTTRLRTLLRAAVRVSFCSGREITAEVLTTSQDARSVVSLWQSDRSLEPMAISLSVTLVATFVDRLLGGHSVSNADDTDLHRSLTEVDQQLASRLTEAVRCSLREQAESATPLELTELAGAWNSSGDAWFPDSSLVKLLFDLRFVQGGGSLELWLPIEVAETLAGDRLAEDSSRTSFHHATEKCDGAVSKRSTIVAQLSQTSLPRRELQSLAVGDVLLLPAKADQ
ncbi:MAG: hypothetical protein FD138_638, partial [Planctomycetota bacterium]